MKFNTKTRYGLRAMVEIARETNNNGIFQKDISERQDISNKYLDHIIYALKVAGLITNVKGKKSGYILTRPADQIRILDINNAFEPGICVIDCIERNYKCDRENTCSAKKFWSGLNNIIADYFQNNTLQDLLEQQMELEKKETANQ
ncbi:Rrf2 family transcriptional regulator [Marinilabilia salmonicolor]|uniref:BadM/Rrf2 family transcriptional regulator n=1 Tax=Marinilabilia salmonicolor TaxID=989 RepID=A0A2T0XPT0_9BACT|nr:Rrf2 family transcriptional regulator [Marinilabilia salmonicolor]PRZ00941.1 BadM/Rrf2 family transcriptional regulator [Marinilabilia salmonicolor]RCW31060.1 BadM/Rrf2 family transcriptional regulator [Marinilabilia salmonicolor]